MFGRNEAKYERAGREAGAVNDYTLAGFAYVGEEGEVASELSTGKAADS
jgi:hypothetical protein